MWAKQSTAATLVVGPILDSSGAEYTSAVIGDLSISKNGGTLAALAAAATLTHIANGQYTLVLTTANLDTLGRVQITCNKSTYQMPEVRLMVVPAHVFDGLVLGTDFLQVDAVQVADVTLAASQPNYAPAKVSDVYYQVELALTAYDFPVVFAGVLGTGSWATSLAPAATALSTAVWTNTLATNIGTTNSRIVGTLSSGTHNPQSGDAFARLGAPDGASVSEDIAAVKTDTGNLVTRITSTLFSGITSFANWLGALAGKTADTPTRAEINATTAGANYNETTDSLQAQKDAGSSGGLTSEQEQTLNSIYTFTSAISGSRITQTGPVTPGGDIRLIKGKDYTTVSGSEITLPVSDTGGALYADFTSGTLAVSKSFGARRDNGDATISGSITGVAYATNVTTFTIEVTYSQLPDDLTEGDDWKYMIQRVTSGGKEVVGVEGSLEVLARVV